MKDFIPEKCALCFIEFGLKEALLIKIKKENMGFFCPNGHRQWYKKEAKPLKRFVLK